MLYMEHFNDIYGSLFFSFKKALKQRSVFFNNIDYDVELFIEFD